MVLWQPAIGRPTGRRWSRETPGTDRRGGTVLYIVWVGDEEPFELDGAGPRFELGPQLSLIESELSQSRLYHLVKWSLPPDTKLFVAAVEGRPKFKGMAPGALTWLRSHTQR